MCIERGFIGVAYRHANPIMTGIEQIVQDSSSFSVHEAGCLKWSLVYTGIPEKVGSNASDRMELLARGKQAGTSKIFFLLFLYRLPAEGMA